MRLFVDEKGYIVGRFAFEGCPMIGIGADTFTVCARLTSKDRYIARRSTKTRPRGCGRLELAIGSYPRLLALAHKWHRQTQQTGVEKKKKSKPTFFSVGLGSGSG